jgi:alkylhydroperoxidase family enzyme
MARIAYIAEDEAGTDIRDLLEKLAPLNIFRMMAQAPGLLRPFVNLGSAFLYRGQLDPVLRECAILRVGYLSGATYETAQHEKIGRDIGMTEALFTALKQGPAAEELTFAQRLVVTFVDDLVINVRASDDSFHPVLQHFGTAQTQELVLLTGYYMMVCRFLETFDVDIEPGGAAGLSL